MSLSTPASLARYRQRLQAFNRELASRGQVLVCSNAVLVDRGTSPPPCDSCGGLRSVTSFTPAPPSPFPLHLHPLSEDRKSLYLLSIAPSGSKQNGLRGRLGKLSAVRFPTGPSLTVRGCVVSLTLVLPPLLFPAAMSFTAPWSVRVDVVRVWEQANACK